MPPRTSHHVLTVPQRRAVDMLTRYLKPAHELVNGQHSWLESDARAVEQIVIDLMNVETLTLHVMNEITSIVKRSARQKIRF